METNQKVVECLFKIILLCGRQDIALRGHHDDKISEGSLLVCWYTCIVSLHHFWENAGLLQSAPRITETSRHFPQSAFLMMS